MRNLAMAAFLGSSMMTGASMALLWAFAVQQALVLVIAGPPLMLLAGGVAAGTPSRRYSDLPPLLTPLRPHQPSRPARNGRRRASAIKYARTWPETRGR